MRHTSLPAEPIWTPLAAPEGYEFEIDISRPGGALRYRLLPSGQWLPGPLPAELGTMAAGSPPNGRDEEPVAR